MVNLAGLYDDFTREEKARILASFALAEKYKGSVQLTQYKREINELAEFYVTGDTRNR